MTKDASPTPDPTTAREDSQFHRYTGNDIPWYVRLMWLGFWIFAIAYTIKLLFPAIQTEMFVP